jgi:hypothetical protein
VGAGALRVGAGALAVVEREKAGEGLAEGTPLAVRENAGEGLGGVGAPLGEAELETEADLEAAPEGDAGAEGDAVKLCVIDGDAEGAAGAAGMATPWKL